MVTSKESKGSVYLIHFDVPYEHAKHYIGYTPYSVESRFEKHKAGKGARLLQVLNEKGIDYKIAKVWENEDRNFERRLKNQKNAPRLCPICSPQYEGKYMASLTKARALTKIALEMLDDKKIKVWLDDERPMPSTFDIHVKTPEEAIELLEKNIVEYISLDHDLGLEPDSRNGYMVAKWIEEHAYFGDLVPLAWNCHTANSAGRDNMTAALMNADRFWASKRDEHE